MQNLSTKRVPKNFWNNVSYQYQFLEKLANDFKISSPKEWQKVKVIDVMKKGGSGLLARYNWSLFNILSHLYKDVDWKEEWFDQTPRNFWASTRNQKKFLDSFAKKHNIYFLSDWNSVKNKNIVESGGATLIRKYGSILEARRHLIEKKNDLLPKRNYWTDSSNQRNFLEHLRMKFKIQQPKDWCNITTQQFREEGCDRLLFMYNWSIYDMLRSIYIEIPWDKKWFTRSYINKPTYWQSEFNQRLFMEQLSFKLDINVPINWQKVTPSLLIKHGGRGLITRYNNSIWNVLKAIWPEQVWIGRGGGSQNILNEQLKDIFRSEKILKNFRKVK